MKRKDLTALTLTALFATSPTFAASQTGIPATVETTDFAAANADFPIAADPASEQPILSATAPQPSPSEDFRNRAPVRENVGLPILGGRDEPQTPEPNPEPPIAESRGLGGRVADQIAERIERAVDERVEALRVKFEAERRRWTLKIFFASLGTVVAGTLLGESVKGMTTALVRRLAALGNRVAKRLAAQALERAKKLVESQNGPQS